MLECLRCNERLWTGRVCFVADKLSGGPDGDTQNYEGKVENE